LKGKNATIHEIILKEENFGSLPPWPAECIAELVDYSGSGVLWEGIDSHWAGGPPGYSGLFAIADSDANYGSHVNTGMITCPIDLTGYTTATLEFDNDFYSYSFYDQIGQVLVDGNVEAEYQWGSYYGHETINLDAYAGQSDVEIEFYFDDFDEWSYHWAIDNIIVSGDGGIAYEQNFGETDIPWPPEDPWTLEDYNGDGYTWMPMLAGTWKEPKDAEDYFAIADSDGNMGVVWSDGIKSEPLDIAGAIPDDPLVLFLGATLDVDCQYQEYGANPDNEWGEIRAWSGGSYQVLAMYNTDQGQFHETLNLPLADDVQIEFFYDTGGDDFEWFFSVDNVVVKVMYEEMTLGDPLVWYFEDDAETGGNPLWTAVPDYGGDLWRPYCYPIYHDPVYGPNGEIVSPILEPCPDENYLPNSEPWLFPPPDGEHFWLLEKHHKQPYFDGVNTWGYCEYSYLNNMDNILISPELDLSGIYHAHLVFYVNGALGDGDEFWVCVREKNPDGTWGPWNWMHRVTPFFSWDLINQVDDYINYNHPIGSTPAFMVNLQEYVNDQSTIQVGFRLVSDGSDVGEGVKLDHIKLDVKRDREAPLTTCTITGTKGCNDWYTSDVTVKLSAEDDLVGVKDIFYRIDGGAWQVYNERVQVSADGEHTVEFYAVDEVGNAEEIKTCQAFKIDQTAPTVALSMPESGYLYLFGRPVFQLGRTIVIGDLTAQASASDATSGIDYVEFLVDGEVKSADLTAPFTFDLPKGGLLPASHTLQVKAYDNACNAATGTQTTYLKWF
jgi:hypothetical protein